MNMLLKVKLLIYSVSILFCFCLLLPARAAVLYFDFPVKNYAPGDTAVADIRLRVGSEEKINAVEAKINIPQDFFVSVDFSNGNSLLTFVVPPAIDLKNGNIEFYGIIPGGYGGSALVDQNSDNLLGRLIMRLKDDIPMGTSSFKFSYGSKVYLHDGLGTLGVLTFENGEINIVPKSQKAIDLWGDEIKHDRISPEPFIPDIVKLDNNWFAVFMAEDKETGIDHYEMSETRDTRIWGKIFLNKPKWQKVESPYLLKDQSLMSRIIVKAVDKAGNETTEEIPAKNSLPWYTDVGILEVVGIVIAFVLIYLIWRKKRV